jgi:hypothetical protein
MMAGTPQQADEPPVADTTPALWVVAADGDSFRRVYAPVRLQADTMLSADELAELRVAIDAVPA